MNDGLAQLVATWEWGSYELEDDKRYVYVVTLFDHDFEYHILVSEFPKVDSGLSGKGGTMYSLWFAGTDVDVPVLVREWEQVGQLPPPFIEAATVVEEWYSLKMSLNEQDQPSND